MKITSKQLAIAAFCLTFVLSLELIWQGFEFVNFTLNPIQNPIRHPSDLHTGYVRRGLEYSGIIAIYIYWLLRSKPQNSKPQNSKPQNRLEPETNATQSFLALIKPVWVFFLLAFVGFPVTTDIYSYLHFGWMSWMGVNPYLTPASEFFSPMSSFLVWGQSSTYGPISEILFMVGAAFTPITVVLGVYALKAIFLLLHLTNGYLIWRHLKSSDNRQIITIAYLLNPLLLYEFIAEGHIDVLVSTFCISFIILLRHKRDAAALLAIVAGFFSKTLPVIWLPMTCVFLIRQKQWKSLAIAIFLTVALCTLFGLTIFPNANAWLSIVNPGVAYQTAGSFHNILYISVNTLYNLTQVDFLRPGRIVLGFKLMTYLGFIIFYAWRCLQIYRQRSYDREDLIVEIGWATLLLFLFATPWYQPWYASILLTITALNIKSPRLIAAIFLYALCSTLSYHLLAYKSDNTLLLIVSCITVIPTSILLIGRSPKLISILTPYHKS